MYFFQLGYINFAIFDQYIWLYVGNDTRERPIIENHMRSIEPWHIRWSWVHFEGYFDDLLTVVTSRAQLTRNLLAIAKFLVTPFKALTKYWMYTRQPGHRDGGSLRHLRSLGSNNEQNLSKLSMIGPITVFFMARQHTDARYWYSNSVHLSVCPSVRPSVRPWRSGIIWKRLNISSPFLHYMVAQSL